MNDLASFGPNSLKVARTKALSHSFFGSLWVDKLFLETLTVFL